MGLDGSTAGEDTLNLFSPQKSPVALQDAPGPSDRAEDDVQELQRDSLSTTCFVEIPKLKEEDLADFQRIPGGWEAADRDAKEEEWIIEIINEHTFHGTRYLYALYGDDIIRRVSLNLSYPLRTSHPLSSLEGRLGVPNLLPGALPRL